MTTGRINQVARFFPFVFSLERERDRERKKGLCAPAALPPSPPKRKSKKRVSFD